MINTIKNNSVDTENTNVKSNNVVLTEPLDDYLLKEISDIGNNVKIWVNNAISEKGEIDYIGLKRLARWKKYVLDDLFQKLYNGMIYKPRPWYNDHNREDYRKNFQKIFENSLKTAEEIWDLTYFFENISIINRNGYTDYHLEHIKADVLVDFLIEFKEIDNLANWHYEIKHKDLLIKLMLKDFSKDFLKKILSRLWKEDIKEILKLLGEVNWIGSRNDLLYSISLFRSLNLNDAKEVFNSLPENKKLDLIEFVRRENLWKIDYILNVYNDSLQYSFKELERDEEKNNKKIWSKIARFLFLDRIISKFKKQRNDYEEKRNNIQQEYDFKLSQIELYREVFWENFREEFFENFDRNFDYIQEEIGTWKIDELIRKAYEAQKYK